MLQSLKKECSLFSNLLFLILTLILISFATEVKTDLLIRSPLLAFTCSMLLYGWLLVLIQNQKRYWFHKRLPFSSQINLVNLELLFFLSLYHFVFGGHRFLLNLFGDLTLPYSLFSLVLYFGGLAVYYRGKREHQVRFLLPFTLPFLLLTLIMDIGKVLPDPDPTLFGDSGTVMGIVALITLTMGILLLMMLFLPPIIQWMWKCEPLRESEIRSRLEYLCGKAGFRHAGMKTWTVMKDHITAGIIGILPRFRYVMFTEKLLEEVHPDAVEAILAHEIGHSQRKHLMIYPVIIFGMIICATFFTAIFYESIMESLGLFALWMPSVIWEVLYPFAIFVPYALIVALYFRYVFGYFSRLFERQADLHVFELGVDPHHMIRALDEVGIATGNTHHHPSWHHHSIADRIQFLRQTIEHPELVQQHHRRVRKNVYFFFLFMILGTMILVTPWFSEVSPFKQIDDGLESSSSWMSDHLNAPLRYEVAEKILHERPWKGNPEKIRSALRESLRYYYAIHVPGVLEFYAAKFLMAEGELPASAQMMSQTWRKFDRQDAPPEVLDEFSSQTEEILGELDEGVEKQELQKIYWSKK